MGVLLVIFLAIVGCCWFNISKHNRIRKNCNEEVKKSREKITEVDMANGLTKEESDKKYVDYKQEKEKEYRRTRAKEALDMNKAHIAYCPICHSTSITAQKQGYGVGKAVAGVALTGGIGLLAGGINANKIKRVCLNCGNKF